MLILSVVNIHLCVFAYISSLLCRLDWLGQALTGMLASSSSSSLWECSRLLWMKAEQHHGIKSEDNHCLFELCLKICIYYGIFIITHICYCDFMLTLIVMNKNDYLMTC